MFQVRREVDVEDWQQAVDACAHATFFHTPAWYGLHCALDSKLEPATTEFAFEDGRRVFLPLVKWTELRGMRHHYMSAPGWAYGGWVSAAPVKEDEAAAIVNWARRHLRNLYLRANPFDAVGLGRWDAERTREDAVEVLRLGDHATEEDLLMSYKHSVRKQVKKGGRNGLTVRPAESWEEWERYYGLYRMALERWGEKATSNVPLEAFRHLFALESPHVILWLVLKDDKVVGGNLNFYQNAHAVEWHAAFDPEYFKLGSRNFMVHRIIMDAWQREYAHYDMLTSGGHEGVLRFKRNFGTRSMPAPVLDWRHTPPLLRALDSAHTALRSIRGAFRRDRSGAGPES